MYDIINVYVKSFQNIAYEMCKAGITQKQYNVYTQI